MSSIERRLIGTGREIELLLGCVSAAAGDGDRASVEPREGITWPRLLTMARAHSVLPLLQRGLSAARHAVPAAVFDRLAAHVLATHMHNERLASELATLLALLEARGIAALSLKGPALALLAYGDLAMRQFADLDIFVAPEDVDRARDAMASMGYRFRVSAQTDAVAERDSPTGRVTVDLQWALAPARFRYPATIEDLLQRREPYTLMGVRVWQATVADHLLFLCAHGAKHCWSRLAWIADVAALVRSHPENLDWEHLLGEATRTGSARMLLLGLQLSVELLALELPAPVTKRIRADAAVQSLTTEFRGRLFRAVEDPDFQGSYGFYRGSLMFIRTRERLGDRLPLVRHILHRPLLPLTNLLTPHAEDRALLALPKSVDFLYFALRPLRLAVKHGRRLLRLHAQ